MIVRYAESNMYSILQVPIGPMIRSHRYHRETVAPRIIQRVSPGPV